MNIIGISGLDNSVPFKKREFPQLSSRQYRIAQGFDSAAALLTSQGIQAAVEERPTMRVRNQYHTWAEGQSILFDDSFNHEVYNNSDGVRVILIVDILRPLSFHFHAINWLLTHVVMRHSEESKEVMANIQKYSSAARVKCS